MTRVYRLGRGGGTVRLVVAVAASALLAGCSSSMNRFGPFDGTQANSNPGYSLNSNGSGSVDRTYTSAIPSGRSNAYSNSVETAPLEPAEPRYAESRYAEPRYAEAQTTYAPTRATYKSERKSYASAKSGTVMVNPGDTLYSLSRAHNVDVKQLIAANDIEAPYNIKVGQRLRLPGDPATPRVTPAAATHHIVRPGETLYSISRGNGLKPDVVAQANGIGAPYTVKIGQRLQIPGGGSSSYVRTADVRSGTGAGIAPTKAVATTARPSSVPTPPKNPVRSVSTGSQATKQQAKPAFRGALPSPSPRSANKFRWPVKGKVISRFGSKPNGVRNDGINIAVPSGTSVKAAENGVVAYSGNELKGYGNLVLIKHADNWVTAYAHNSKLLVRRGDRVTRGQVIAKAGRTGSVTSPQLHFEVRRGSQAIDPLKALDRRKYAGG